MVDDFAERKKSIAHNLENVMNVTLHLWNMCLVYEAPSVNIKTGKL
jgi:hypothetical protein